MESVKTFDFVSKNWRNDRILYIKESPNTYSWDILENITSSMPGNSDRIKSWGKFPDKKTAEIFLASLSIDEVDQFKAGYAAGFSANGKTEGEG